MFCEFDGGRLEEYLSGKALECVDLLPYADECALILARFHTRRVSIPTNLVQEHAGAHQNAEFVANLYSPSERARRGLDCELSVHDHHHTLSTSPSLFINMLDWYDIALDVGDEIEAHLTANASNLHLRTKISDSPPPHSLPTQLLDSALAVFHNLGLTSSSSNRSKFKGYLSQLRELFADSCMEVRFCHNDAQEGNIMLRSDSRLQLIDFECLLRFPLTYA